MGIFNKYVLLMIMFVFLVIITLVADSVLLTTSEDLLSGVVVDTTYTSSGIFTMIGTFFKIITFQLPQIPLVVNLLVFYPLSLGIIYMIVDILKDLIPFT